MSEDNKQQASNNSDIVSLPANSSWWKFFVTAYFGKNYLNFKGRASRKEYWGIIVLYALFSMVLSILLAFMAMVFRIDISLIVVLIQIYVILPNWAIVARRFHDINMSAWWSLLFIPLFFLPFFKGDRKDNKYGKNIYENVE